MFKKVHITREELIKEILRQLENASDIELEDAAEDLFSHEYNIQFRIIQAYGGLPNEYSPKMFEKGPKSEKKSFVHYPSRLYKRNKKEDSFSQH